MSTSLPRSMPALCKLNDAPGLNFCQDVPVPEPGPRDVLVAVTHAGICGTDRHIYEWDAWSRNRVKLGITTGHEFVGRVVAVGEATQRIEVGQRVSAEGHIGCGFCEACRTGNGHICETVDILGIDCNGCFAPFISVPETNIWPVHPEIPDKVAAVFDPLGNAVHTVMAAGVSGKTVLITGVGIIGLMAVTVAKAAGATRIFVTDVDPRRLELAMKLGAEQSFDAREPWVEKLRQTCRGGPEVLLEMSGHATAIRHGLEALRNGGRAALLGIPADEVKLDLSELIIFSGATVLGINGRKMFETWYQMENLILSEQLELDSIITHQIDMKDFETGFAMMQSGEAIKVVMKIPQSEGEACQTVNSTSEQLS